MIRQSLYAELGGMQADKYEAYFEDTDLAMSILHKRGLPVQYHARLLPLRIFQNAPHRSDYVATVRLFSIRSL